MSEAFAAASDTFLDEIVLELDVLQPDEETLLRSKYSRIHNAVAAAVARGTSPRQILELLKRKGLELHHATLTKLFKAELAARDEHGERVCCVSCGQSLHVREQHHTEESTPLVDTTGTNGEVAA
jgi:hypothetical protein